MKAICSLGTTHTASDLAARRLSFVITQLFVKSPIKHPTLSSVSWNKRKTKSDWLHLSPVMYEDYTWACRSILEETWRGRDENGQTALYQYLSKKLILTFYTYQCQWLWPTEEGIFRRAPRQGLQGKPQKIYLLTQCEDKKHWFV